MHYTCSLLIILVSLASYSYSITYEEERFIDAAQQGNLAQLEQYSSRVSTLNIQDRRGRTALHEATEAGHILIIEALINKPDIDIAIKDELGNTPLHIATFKNLPNAINIILSHNTKSIAELNNEGLSPLHYAIKNNYLGCIESILKADPRQINSKDKDGWTSLHYAARLGNRALVDYLLKYKNINPDIQDHSGNTPFHVMLIKSNLNKTPKYLIEEGNARVYDPNNYPPVVHPTLLPDYNSISEVTSFIVENYQHIALLLLKASTTIAVKNNLSQTSLDIAKQSGYYAIYTLIEKFIAAKHCLFEAVLTSSSDTKTVRNSIKHISFVNVKDAHGNTPLHYAVLTSNTSCIQLLLSLGANYTITNKAGQTPLDWAIGHDNNESLKCFLKAAYC